MEAARVKLVSVDDYLSGEPASEVRHEYVVGAVYAMAGASEEHNDLTLNLASALRLSLARRAVQSVRGGHEGADGGGA